MNTIFVPNANFYLEELTASPTAVMNTFTEQFTPPADVVENLKLLVINILQPLRLFIDKPVIVSSGYRCMRTNAKVGGVSNSQHIEGRAADINVPGYSVEELYQYLRSTNLPFDQLIQEFDAWVHISFTNVGSGRQQCLRYSHNGNSYDTTPRTITKVIPPFKP